MMASFDFRIEHLQKKRLRVLLTVKGAAGVFPLARYCISQHPKSNCAYDYARIIGKRKPTIYDGVGPSLGVTSSVETPRHILWDLSRGIKKLT